MHLLILLGIITENYNEGTIYWVLSSEGQFIEYNQYIHKIYYISTTARDYEYNHYIHNRYSF